MWTSFAIAFVVIVALALVFVYEAKVAQLEDDVVELKQHIAPKPDWSMPFNVVDHTPSYRNDLIDADFSAN